MSMRRNVLLRFAVLLAIVGTASFVWSPLPLDRGAHQYADTRMWLGVPNAANVLANLPIFWLAVGGWCATRTSRWPHALRLPWQAFHLCVMVASLSAAMYHAAPSNFTFVVTRTCMAGAFVLLALGMLAERVGHRFGSPAACASALIFTVMLGAVAAMASRNGYVDPRPLQLVEAVPILLILAGLLRLPGVSTSARGWMLALVMYGASLFFASIDADLLRFTGWISGHTLMHLALSMVVGWMTYWAVAARSDEVRADGGESQRQTSLNTIG